MSKYPFRLLARFLTVLTVMVGILGLFPTPVHAAPINTPTSWGIHNVWVYRSYIDVNDQLWVVSFTIHYAVNPTEGTAEELFLVRVLDGATGAEQIAVAPYAYFDNGYDKGYATVYFAAGAVPTWTGNYIVQLAGNPTAPDGWAAGAPPYVNFASGSIVWNDSADPATTANSMTVRTRALTSDLEVTWNDLVNYDLIVPSAAGLVLTEVGEGYVTQVVYEVRNMLPDLFQMSETAATFDERTYTHTYANALIATSAGTTLDMRDLISGLTGGVTTGQNEGGMLAMGIVSIAVFVVCFLFGGFWVAMAVAMQLWLASGYMRIIFLGWAQIVPALILGAMTMWRLFLSKVA